MAKHSHLKPALVNLTLVIVSIAITLFLLEASLRVAGYQGESDRQRMTFSPHTGDIEKDSWVFKLDAANSQAETMRINESNVSIRKQPGTTRILFIGDSGTVGTGVEYAESFPFRFGEYFKADHPDQEIEVINAGVYGMTTIAEYHLLRDKLIVLNPDVIVMGLFMANDINLNLLHNAKKLRLEEYPRLYSALQAAKEHSALMHYVILKLLAIEQKFQTPQILKEQTFRPAQLSLRDENGLNLANYFEGEIATYYKEHSSLTAFAFEILEMVLHDTKDIATQLDARLAIILIPTASAIMGRLEMLAFPEPASQIRREQGKHKVNLNDLDFSKPTAMVLAICARLDITCIDPTPALQNVGLDAILPGDDHLSVTGHEIVAKELVRSSEIFK